MAALQPDHYDTLGVPPSATPIEIKRRYRELAQRYHPDVNHDPEAAGKISLINEAYRVLGDPERRATYDAEQLLAKKAAATRAAQYRAAERRTAAQSRGGRHEPRVEFNGFGRASVRPDSSSKVAPNSPPTAGSYRSAAAERRAAERSVGIERLLAEARLAYANRQYHRVESLCVEIIRSDRRNAAAYEILGDARLKLKHTEGAITAWTYAIQLNPRNYSLQGRLDRLAGVENAHRGPQPSASHRERGIHRSDGAFSRGQESSIAVVNIVGMLMLVAVGTLLVTHPGTTSSPGSIFEEVLGCGAVGVLSGLLLALNARMRPVAEELSSSIGPERRSAPVALGPLLTAFALVSFYLSLFIFLVVGVKRRRLSMSVTNLYSTVLIIVVLLAALGRPGDDGWRELIAMWSGNVLFPSALLGWCVGDSLRLRQ